MGYRWRRFRLCLKKKQNQEEVNDLVKRLKAFYAFYRVNKVDLYFGDEVGFSLKPSMAYGWQLPKKQVRILPKNSKRINIFGLLSPCNTLCTYSTEKTVDGSFICECINDFSSKIKRETVIVLDNAPVHRNQQFYKHIEDWNKKGLYIFFLPKYSPHLNIIETLWRFMKYKWLKPEDYTSWTKFKKKINCIIEQYGVEYKINFDLNTFTRLLLS
ncbi:IS630 family transposase [Flammeovirga aprica]|uniref:IS630 family transposase n=1 Tax=Flammeovirga aprica JL-4 TaxID=694437 RepID=A0A7X9S1N2_9BACT|nr:IS630 family transposase [Flammeovirga aprica]NME72752.1 IS630 family transposase [Flammeovirga aprica JL-4]